MTPLVIAVFINTIALAYCGPHFLLQGPTAQSTITGQDGTKLVSEAIAGSITSKGVIGPTFKATTIVENSRTTTGGNGAYGQSSHGCGSACGGDSAHLQGDATKYDRTIVVGPAGSSDSQSVDATIYGQDGSKIVSHVEPGSISDNAIVGPTFDASMEIANTHVAGGGGASGLTSYNCGGNCGSTNSLNSSPYPGKTTTYGQDGTSQGIIGPTFKASTSVENTQGSVHGQFSYNCGGACGVGGGHLSSEGTKYNPTIAAGPTDTSNSNIGQSTTHRQGSKTTSEANSGSILNGRVVGPTFTSSTTGQGTAANDVYGHSSYNCDGGACGIVSTTTNKGGTTGGSNPNNHSVQATIYGQERSKIVSQTHGGSILSAGGVAPKAYTTVQNKQDVVGNGASGQSSYNCGGKACEFGSTNLSHEGTNGVNQGTSTLNGNHSSQEHAVASGQDGSKIVSQVYHGSISNKGNVGPTFGTSTSAENTPVGSESGPGESRQVDTVISHPYHQHSVVHDHGGSRIVSEASAGSILNKGVVGSTFKAYTTANNGRFTGGESVSGYSKHNLSKQYIQNHSTTSQEFVRTSNPHPHLFGGNVLGQQPSTTTSITGSTVTGGVAKGGPSKYGNNEFSQDNAENSQPSTNCNGNTCGSKTETTIHEFGTLNDGQRVTIHSHIPGSSIHESSQKFGYSVLHGNSQRPIGSSVNAGTANHADISNGVQGSNSNTIIPGNLVYQSSKNVEYNGPSHSNARHPTSDYNINSNGPSASSIKQATPDHQNANAQGVGQSVPNTSPVYGQGQNAGAYDSSSIVSATHTHPSGQFIGHGYYRTSSYAHPGNVFVQDAGSSGNNKFLSGQLKGYLPPSTGDGDGANSRVNYNFGNGQDYIESSSFAPATYRRPGNVGSNTQGTAVSSFEGTVRGSGNRSYDCYVIKFPINAYGSNIPADLSLFLKKLVQSSSIKPDVYYFHKHHHHSNY